MDPSSGEPAVQPPRSARRRSRSSSSYARHDRDRDRRRQQRSRSPPVVEDNLYQKQSRRSQRSDHHRHHHQRHSRRQHVESRSRSRDRFRHRSGQRRQDDYDEREASGKRDHGDSRISRRRDQREQSYDSQLQRHLRGSCNDDGNREGNVKRNIDFEGENDGNHDGRFKGRRREALAPQQDAFDALRREHRGSRGNAMPIAAVTAEGRGGGRGVRERMHRDDRVTKEGDGKGKPTQVHKPNWEPSGRLAAASKTVIAPDSGRKVELKYHEPAEARRVNDNTVQYRLYVFGCGDSSAAKKNKNEKTKHIENEEAVEPDDKTSSHVDVIDELSLNTRSCWLFGREEAVANVVVPHESVSKQHAVVQFRHVESRNCYGDRIASVKPYLLDLESANGTSLNGALIDDRRYYELRDKDLIQFADCPREYVLIVSKSEESNRTPDIRALKYIGESKQRVTYEPIIFDPLKFYSCRIHDSCACGQ